MSKFSLISQAQRNSSLPIRSPALSVREVLKYSWKAIREKTTSLQSQNSTTEFSQKIAPLVLNQTTSKLPYVRKETKTTGGASLSKRPSVKEMVTVTKMYEL